MYTNENEITEFPWFCDFGTIEATPDWCGIVQDAQYDQFNWTTKQGDTPTEGTGPPNAGQGQGEEIYVLLFFP